MRRRAARAAWRRCCRAWCLRRHGRGGWLLGPHGLIAGCRMLIGVVTGTHCHRRGAAGGQPGGASCSPGLAAGLGIGIALAGHDLRAGRRGRRRWRHPHRRPADLKQPRPHGGPRVRRHPGTCRSHRCTRRRSVQRGRHMIGWAARRWSTPTAVPHDPLRRLDVPVGWSASRRRQSPPPSGCRSSGATVTGAVVIHPSGRGKPPRPGERHLLEPTIILTTSPSTPAARPPPVSPFCRARRHTVGPALARLHRIVFVLLPLRQGRPSRARGAPRHPACSTPSPRRPPRKPPRKPGCAAARNATYPEDVRPHPHNRCIWVMLKLQRSCLVRTRLLVLMSMLGYDDRGKSDGGVLAFACQRG